MIRTTLIGLIAVLLCLGLTLAPAAPPAEAADIGIPKIPIIGPGLAACIEVGKVCVSPVTQLVDQAYNREYKGYPVSLVTEGVNGVINTGVNMYQGLAPWEWVLNKDLYAPPNDTIYNGGLIPLPEP